MLGKLTLPGNRVASRQRVSNLSFLFHVVAACWVVAMLLLARYYPQQYSQLVQEDRPIEWATVFLFAAAAVLHFRNAVQNRLYFNVLVAIFCLFVAGEEFSWGQRLIGYGSPQYFLENNYQQEVNLHNLPGSFLKPKWMLIAALAGYGILLPIAARFGRIRDLMTRIGATPPPTQLSFWFAAAVILLLWYPFTLTGEWVEALAGGLFVASVTWGRKAQWILISFALIFGVSMTRVTDAIEHTRDVDRSACARAEIQGLVNDLTAGDAAAERLKSRRTLHKRVWTAVREGLVNRESTREFDTSQCTGSMIEESQNRRRYAVDPWGMSYWLSVKQVDESLQRVVVYSFGPNRRRDGSPGATTGDDIVVVAHARREAQNKSSTTDTGPTMDLSP